ncbi:uncharacterized [Tachysurus ichikawai]
MWSGERKSERTAMLPASGSVSSILTKAHTAGDSMSNLHLFFLVNRVMLIKKGMEIGRKKSNTEQGILNAADIRDTVPEKKIKSKTAQCSGDITSCSGSAASVYGMTK